MIQNPGMNQENSHALWDEYSIALRRVTSLYVRAFQTQIMG